MTIEHGRASWDGAVKLTDLELRLTPTTSSLRVLVLEFIRRFYYDHGQSPSLSEIGHKFGVTRQKVSRIVRELYRRGEIYWTPGKARSIKLPDRAAELSDTEVIELLRRRGWIVVGRVPARE